MKELPSDRLRAQVALSAYVKSKFPDLKLSGARGQFRCACPIHGSTNSSTFSIDDKKGYWTCFGGCGSGSVIDFWLRVNNRPNSDALVAMEQIAKDMHVDIGLSDQSQSDELSKRDLYRVVKAVCDAAHDRLVKASTSSAKEALDYLLDRGLDDDDLDSWNLGIFPDRKSIVKWMLAVAKDAVGNKAKEALIATQLLEKSQYADEMFSQFADRIVFPIRDDSDNYLAVSCRILPSQQSEKKKDGKPKSKYINSRNTAIFDKSSVLFGEHRASFYGKSKTTTVFVCEGQMDVISLSWVLADDEIAVATCGTALTEEHMEWLARFKRSALMFDNDDAGKRALVKASSIVNFIGSKNASSVSLSSGKDANEIAVVSEQSLIDDIATGTRPLFHDVAEAMWSDAEESPTALLAAAREVSERITRSVERQRLFDALEEASGIPADKISRELSMSITHSKTQKGSKSKQESEESLSESLVPLASWLASLDSLTRQTLLLDMDDWLESDHVSQDLLGVSNKTDEAVLTYLAIGRDMSENYTDSQIEQSVSILTELVASSNNAPYDHFVRIARVLVDDMKHKSIGKQHLRFLLSVINRTSGMDNEKLFNALGDIINELC